MLHVVLPLINSLWLLLKQTVYDCIFLKNCRFPKQRGMYCRVANVRHWYPLSTFAYPRELQTLKRLAINREGQ